MTDEKDKKIIEALRKNARARNVDIAAAVAMTEGAVRARISRLLKNGIIRKFTIETSEEDTNMAVVMVKAKRNTKSMMHDILRLRLARNAYEIAGEYDCCLILEDSDISSIDKKIDKLRTLKTVMDTKTFIVMRGWV